MNQKLKEKNTDIHTCTWIHFKYHYDVRLYFWIIFIFILFFNCKKYLNTAYPAVYGQFPQVIPQPLATVAPSQREGKF